MTPEELAAIRERYTRAKVNDPAEPVANRILWWGASANDVPAQDVEVDLVSAVFDAEDEEARIGATA